MSSATRPDVPRAHVPVGRAMTLVWVVAVLAVLYFGRDILMPLALAALVTFALGQLVARMERIGLGRTWAVGLVVGTLMLVLSCIGWIVVTQTKSVLRGIPDYRMSVALKIRSLASNLPAMAPLVDALASYEGGAAQRNPAVAQAKPSENQPLDLASSDPSPALLRQVPAALGSLLNPIGTVGIAMLFAMFMLLNREDLRNRFIRLISNGDLTGTTQALTEAWKRIGRYLGIQLILNWGCGLCVALGLWLLGVPGWALWGFLYALLRFLPYVGAWAGASMPVAMALAAEPGWNLFLQTAALLVVLETFVNLVLEPWLYGGRTGVSPFAVLVSAAVWTWLWGPIGLLIAMPLTVALLVLGESLPHLDFLRVLLGTDEALSPTDRYYQRVMANDPDEAIRILEEVAAEQSSTAIYETLLVPALTATERDRAAGKLTEQQYAALCENIRDSFDAMEVQKPNGSATAVPSANADPGLLRQDEPGGVVCLPVTTGANEVAAALLCPLLQRAGHACRTPSTDLTPGERIDGIDSTATVCIVTLPDPTLRHVRAMCKRVKLRRPDLKVVVMAWGAAVDPSVWKYRSLGDCSDALATKVADLVLAVGRLRQGLPSIELAASGALPAAS